MGESAHVRRIIGLLAATLALCVAVVGSRALQADRRESARQEIRRAAERAGQRAADALTAELVALRLKADNAASNPRLVFALQGDADERTLRDLWRTEEWWRPWRRDFKVYALAFSGTRLEVVEGIASSDGNGRPSLNTEALVRRVRDSGEATADIVTGPAGSFEAAATLVTVPGRDHPAVLLLARPLDQAALAAVIEQAGGAVAVLDGGAVLVEAGAEGERALLKAATAAQPQTSFVEAADGSWAAARSPLAGRLTLLTLVAAAPNARAAGAVAGGSSLVIYGVAALAAAVALSLGFRRSRRPGAAPVTVGAALSPTGPGGLPDTLQGPAAMTPPSGGAEVPSATVERATGHRATEVAPLAAPNVPAADATFGRYTLLDRLGEGGMAQVYTAVTFGARGFRRKFVVKRLRPELAREPAVVDQFIDEANLASSLVHSNIVPVFDFGKVNDEYFLAQEYILGRDLARFTRQSLGRDGRPAPAPAVLYIAFETLKALEYAHTKTSDAGAPLGIVPRDVSPGNILVSARGEVKLFDFGIVKAEGRVTKTESGVVKGNVTFMSPEQARGGDIDARADLFSLGLVMFYVLTGRALYSGTTTYELLVRAATGPGADEQAALRSLQEPCGSILRRALQVPREDRYQTAREFREAIAPHLGGGGVELAALVHHLFAEDFRAEETRFRAIDPVATPPVGSAALDAPSARRS